MLIDGGDCSSGGGSGEGGSGEGGSGEGGSGEGGSGEGGSGEGGSGECGRYGGSGEDVGKLTRKRLNRGLLGRKQGTVRIQVVKFLRFVVIGLPYLLRNLAP